MTLFFLQVLTYQLHPRESFSIEMRPFFRLRLLVLPESWLMATLGRHDRIDDFFHCLGHNKYRSMKVASISAAKEQSGIALAFFSSNGKSLVFYVTERMMMLDVPLNLFHLEMSDLPIFCFDLCWE